MKLGRNVEARVFCKEGEDEEKIKERLRSLFPFVLEDEKIELSSKAAEGLEHKRILVFTVLLKKDRHINAFIKNLFRQLDSEKKDILIKQLDSRIDDHLNFFLRFDKDRLLDDNVLWLTDSGNCFHLRIGIASYPSNKFAAKKTMQNIINMPLDEESQ